MRGVSLGVVLCALIVSVGCDRVAIGPATPTGAEDLAQIAPAPTQRSQLAACPLAAPNPDELSALAARGDFAALDARAEQARSAYSQSVDCEARVGNLIHLYKNFDMNALDAWVAARPDSWAASSSRGAKWVALAVQRSRQGGPRDEQLELLDRARSDLDRALEIDPASIPAAGSAIEVLRLSGDVDQIPARLDALLERDPLTYLVRRIAQDGSSPSAGGSVDAMRAIAEDAQRYADRNPRLRILMGFVEVESNAGPLSMQKRYAEAAASYRKALRYGHFLYWYEGLVQSLEMLDDWQGVLDATEPWIAELGDEQAQSYAWRGRALARLGRGPEALAAYDRALEVAPQYPWAQQLRGAQYLELGMLSEAVADFNRSLAVYQDPWTVGALAQIASADPSSVASSAAVLHGYLEKHPEDVSGWFALGSALHASRAPDARAALERYVALARSDAQQQTRVAQAQRMLEPAAPRAAALPGQARLGLKSGS